MSVTPNYVPRDYHTISASLVVRDIEKALRFYNNAFGAEVVNELKDGNGTPVFAEMKIDDTIVMLTKEDPAYQLSPETTGSSGVVIQIYTGDAEGLFESAIMGGATEVFPLKEQFYGDRAGRVKDPFGHQWIIATHVEDVPPAEMKRRFDQLFS